MKQFIYTLLLASLIVSGCVKKDDQSSQDVSAVDYEAMKSELLIVRSQFTKIQEDFYDAARELKDLVPYFIFGPNKPAINGVIESYNCSVIAKTLGKDFYFKKLQPKTDSLNTIIKKPKTADDYSNNATVYWDLGDLYSVYNYRIDEMLNKTHDQRVYLWNFSCIGNFGIPKSEYFESENSWQEEVKFSYDENRKSLIFLGDVETGFSDKLMQLIKEHPDVETIGLGSAGGNVDEALIAGTHIRRMRLNTELAADCLSACPLVFLGGIDRIAMLPAPQIGFHQVYYIDKTNRAIAVLPYSDTYQRISDYIEYMGANKNIVLRYIFTAQPDSMYYPKVENYCLGKVFTWVQRTCSTDDAYDY